MLIEFHEPHEGTKFQLSPFCHPSARSQLGGGADLVNRLVFRSLPPGEDARLWNTVQVRALAMVLLVFAAEMRKKRKTRPK